VLDASAIISKKALPFLYSPTGLLERAGAIFNSLEVESLGKTCIVS